jgi:hypothetical protein
VENWAAVDLLHQICSKERDQLSISPIILAITIAFWGASTAILQFFVRWMLLSSTKNREEDSTARFHTSTILWVGQIMPAIPLAFLSFRLFVLDQTPTILDEHLIGAPPRANSRLFWVFLSSAGA